MTREKNERTGVWGRFRGKALSVTWQRLAERQLKIKVQETRGFDYIRCHLCDMMNDDAQGPINPAQWVQSLRSNIAMMYLSRFATV